MTKVKTLLCIILEGVIYKPFISVKHLLILKERHTQKSYKKPYNTGSALHERISLAVPLAYRANCPTIYLVGTPK